MKNRFALVVLDKLKLTPALLVNASAIAMGGLKSSGFDEPIVSKAGIPNAAIKWNVPILKAKTQKDFLKVAKIAAEHKLVISSFSEEGMSLSNSFEAYVEIVKDSEALTILAMAIYGEEDSVKTCVKFLSVL